MSSDETSRPPSIVLDASKSSANAATPDDSQALPATNTQLERSPGRAARHSTAPSHSHSRSPSSSPRPSPPPFSIPVSPLHSLSQANLFSPESGALASELNTAIPSTQPSSDPPPLPAPLSLARSQSTQGLDTGSTRPTDKPSDDLVDPLLRSFASLHVQDGAACEATDIPSPPLCSLDQRATLLTKNGTNPYFVSTVARVKGSQQALSKKASQLDQDIVEARAQAIQHLSAALQVLLHARERIGQRQLIIETGCRSAKELVEDLESKLRKAQRDITTLRAEHIAATGLLEQMASDVAYLRTQDEELLGRLHRTGNSLAAASISMDAITALADELRAQNLVARQYTYTPRPSFVSDTSVDDMSSHNSAPSSHSQSFAEPWSDSHAKAEAGERDAGQQGDDVASDTSGGQNRQDDHTFSREDGGEVGETDGQDRGENGEQNGDETSEQGGGVPSALGGNITGNTSGGQDGDALGGQDGRAPSGLAGNRSSGQDGGQDGSLSRNRNGDKLEKRGSGIPAGRTNIITSLCAHACKRPVLTILEAIADVFSCNWLSTILTTRQNVVKRNIANPRGGVSLRATSIAEQLIALASMVPGVLPWSLFAAISIYLAFAVYSRFARATPPSTEMDSPIWESLAPNL